ncbi:MAG: histidinol phosphate phosphatase domain-containing protein [Candidatus Omnitrophota bacterium]|nr:histidinol phosphate phosphatase domain-containing protein [Candidatus Omnitrophota bacterium]
MIDLHTHTILSDGDLIPSELVRRAYVAGCQAIALTDHVDHSNIDVVTSGAVKVSRVLNRYWDILVIPGVEITHVPVEVFPELVRYARRKGAKIIVGHGESPVEPVIAGTNAAAINAGVDILAHPGFIKKEDARLAAEKGVYLEITFREGHSDTNKHVFDTAIETGAKMVLNTDTHSPEDILTKERIGQILQPLTDKDSLKESILLNSQNIVDRITKRSNGVRP